MVAASVFLLFVQHSLIFPGSVFGVYPTLQQRNASEYFPYLHLRNIGFFSS